MTQLKHVIDSPCGLRPVIDLMDLQSGLARRWMLDQPLMSRRVDIEKAYAVLQRWVAFIRQTEAVHLGTLRFRLQGLKDIRTTIKNLSQRAVLDDIELFEVKHLALLTTAVAQLMEQHQMSDVANLPDMQRVIDLLDPDGLHIDTFYVYDSYSDELAQLRATMRRQPERHDELLLQAAELELRIRQRLSHELHPLAARIEQAQLSLARMDVNLAQATLLLHMGLCMPRLSADGTTHYRGLFHPQVRQSLSDRGKHFQPVDVAYGGTVPTLVTGANMGGKTVLLKTLALCHYLLQLGMGLPAETACVTVSEQVHLCMGDNQSVEQGLSSFAAEMRQIDRVIQAARSGIRVLALIDEPARTTNPTEGTALVQALLDVLRRDNVSLVMTTHYDIQAQQAHCLRVKGLEDGEMNYTLVEVHHGEAPHEALNIAQSLGIDQEWIDTARQLLDKD